jgi:hypothetical protein
MNAQSDFRYEQTADGTDALVPIGNMEMRRIRSYAMLAAADVVAITFL